MGGRAREGRKGEEKGKSGGEGKAGREEKGRGTYRDEGPLTKILSTPLLIIMHIFSFAYSAADVTAKFQRQMYPHFVIDRLLSQLLNLCKMYILFVILVF